MVDAVVFGDGTAVPVEYHRLAPGGVAGVGARIRDRARRSLHPSVRWIEVAELAEVEDPSAGLRFSCGEGSFGGDGYVACAGLRAGELLWAAVFQESNPFVTLRLAGEWLEARNTHGHV